MFPTLNPSINSDGAGGGGGGGGEGGGERRIECISLCFGSGEEAAERFRCSSADGLVDDSVVLWLKRNIPIFGFFWIFD